MTFARSPDRNRYRNKLVWIKGAWSAYGHSFDDHMRCSHCGRSYAQYQADPQRCDGEEREAG